MGEKLGVFLATPVGSWVRVFIFAALTLYLTDLAADGVAVDWEGYVIAGVLAVGPVFLAWLNPADPRWGRGSTTPAGGG